MVQSFRFRHIVQSSYQEKVFRDLRAPPRPSAWAILAFIKGANKRGAFACGLCKLCVCVCTHTTASRGWLPPNDGWGGWADLHLYILFLLPKPKQILLLIDNCSFTKRYSLPIEMYFENLLYAAILYPLKLSFHQ